MLAQNSGRKSIKSLGKSQEECEDLKKKFRLDWERKVSTLRQARLEVPVVGRPQLLYYTQG